MTPETASPVAAPDEIEVARGRQSRSWRSWIFALAILGAAFVLQALAQRAPHFIERYYNRTIFPPIGHALSFVNGVVGISLGEIIVVGLIALIFGGAVFQVLRILQRPGDAAKVVARTLLMLLWGLSLALMLFLLLWGLNYHREPLGISLNLAKQTPTDDQLEAISRSIVNGINENYEASHDAACCASLDRPQLYNLIESAYQDVPLLAGVCTGGYARPKPIRMSGIMSWFGIAGVYIPYTGEANFNALQPDFDLPYAIAHEKAHQCGIAREDEANFVAFLVCANSTNPFVRYSGYLHALNVVWQLRRSATDRGQAVSESLGAGPRADLRARAAFWARFQGRGMVVGHKINNSYLKANNVSGGTQSYSEDVALIISYYLRQASHYHR